MRCSSIIMAVVATLASAAPVTEKRQSLADLLGLSSFNSNDLIEDFSSNSFSEQDLIVLLESSDSFNLDSFNSEFDSSFNDQEILQLLLSLEGNQFGLSDFNSISDSSVFDLSSFSSVFNESFDASWSEEEIEALLLELGLVGSDEFGGLSNSFSNIGDESSFNQGSSSEGQSNDNLGSNVNLNSTAAAFNGTV